MKLSFAALMTSLLSTVVDAGVQTCSEQKPCLDYSITKVSGSGCYPGECEFKVCWRQVMPSENAECTKSDSFR